jgi:hypothetical protein
VTIVAGLDSVEKILVAVLTDTSWTVVAEAAQNECKNEPKSITIMGLVNTEWEAGWAPDAVWII